MPGGPIPGPPMPPGGPIPKPVPSPEYASNSFGRALASTVTLALENAVFS